MACNDINQVEVAVSSKLQRQIDEYRVDMEFFTLKEAETIVNFISADPDDRRIRNKYVWENTCLRNSAYFVLFQLLEKMCQSTPFSIVDRHLSGFSSLIRTVKERSFEGAWLDELVGFVHENEKNTKDSVKELKCFEKDCKDTTDIAATRLKFCDAELQDMKAQIKEAKKARKGGIFPAIHNNKSKVHECSTCGSEFTSGQVLGGHMRRHRPPVGTNTTLSLTPVALEPEEEDQPRKKRNVLSLDLDLNLPVPEDDQRESKFAFASKQQQQQQLQNGQKQQQQQVLSSQPQLWWIVANDNK